jgi:cold shock protein
MEGTVKWFNRKKGFGFIIGDDNIEYFIHYSALGQGTYIRDNDKVSFDPIDGEKGKQAQKVTLIQKASERSDIPQDSEGSNDQAGESAPQKQSEPEKSEEEKASTDF